MSEKADIEPGCYIAHDASLVIGGQTKAGKNSFVRQNITTSGNGSLSGLSTFGDNCTLCANAVIVGPMFASDNDTIGANSDMSVDIATNFRAVGVNRLMAAKNC
jgi:serine O-acetyltransferase